MEKYGDSFALTSAEAAATGLSGIAIYANRTAPLIHHSVKELHQHYMDADPNSEEATVTGNLVSELLDLCVELGLDVGNDTHSEDGIGEDWLEDDPHFDNFFDPS